MKAGSTPLHSSASRRTAPPVRASIPLRYTASNRRRRAAPARCTRKLSPSSHQSAGRRSGPCRNFRPHDAPKISLTSAAPGKPLALRLPVSHQATAPRLTRPAEVSQRGPASRPLAILALAPWSYRRIARQSRWPDRFRADLEM